MKNPSLHVICDASEKGAFSVVISLGVKCSTVLEHICINSTTCSSSCEFVCVIK